MSRYHERMAEKLKTAELIKDTGQAVYSPDLELYFADTEELREHCECDDTPLPERVFPCKVHPALPTTTDDLFERYVEEFYEDMPKFTGIEEFRAAYEKFRLANDWVGEYEEDTSKAIVVEPTHAPD